MKCFLNNVQLLVLCMGMLEEEKNVARFQNLIFYFRSGNIEEFNSYELMKNLQQHVNFTIKVFYCSIVISFQDTRDTIREFLTLLATCHTVIPENKVHTELPTEVAYQASSPGKMT